MKAIVFSSLLFMALAGAPAASSPGQIPEGVFDLRTKPADEALKGARQSGDYSVLKEALRPLFLNPDVNVKLLGLQWVGFHRRDLPETVVSELETVFIELNPESSLSRSVRETKARREFASEPQAKRIPVYREAVTKGSVEAGEGFTLSRLDALMQAAAEGLSEFLPEIEKYHRELDTIGTSRDPSGRLRWLMKLRAGATDRKQAVHLHALRLNEMSVEEFEKLMQEDSEFSGSTVALAKEACPRTGAGEDCLILEGLVERVLSREKTGKGAEMAIRQESRESPEWLSELRTQTYGARTLKPTEAKAPSHQAP